MQEQIDKFRAETAILGKVVALFEASLGAPVFYHSGKSHRGFRYLNPTAKHFCLVKAVRAVSGTNAAIKLLEGGFTQEISVLVRTIVECASHIDFVLAGLSNGVLPSPQKELVAAYFADFKRDRVSDFKRPRVRQGDVHQTVGRHLDDQLKSVEGGAHFAGVDTSKLMSDVYLTFSNYVHARYPEVMDMYGGHPGRFHIDGMLGTPKDHENLQTIECFIETVSNALRAMVYKFNLAPAVERSPVLTVWLRASSKMFVA